MIVNMNTTSFGRPLKGHQSIPIIDGFLVFVIAIFALLENIVVLILLWKIRAFRTPTNIFMTCPTLADIFVALLPLPLFFVVYVLPCQPSTAWYSAYYIADYVSSAMSITSLSILAFDRYFIIIHPYVYQRRMTLNIALTVVAINSLYAIAVGILAAFMSESWFALFIIITVYGIPSFVMFFSHISVAIVAKRHAKNILKLQVHKSPVISIKKKYSVLRKISRANFGPAENTVKQNKLTLNPGIGLDFFSASSSVSSGNRLSIRPEQQQNIKLCNISEQEPNKIRFRVTVGNNKEVVIEKNLQEESKKTKIKKSKNKRKKVKRISPQKPVNSWKGKKTPHSLETACSENDLESADHFDTVWSLDRRETLTNFTLERLNSISSMGKKRKKPKKEKNIVVLQHSTSSPQFDIKHHRLKKTNSSASLPTPNASAARKRSVASINFRRVVKRNIDANRQKRLIRDEVYKVIQQIRRLKVELKATILLTIVMVIFLLLWTPSWYIHFLVFANKFDYTNDTHLSLLKYFRLLHYLNAGINPIYYVLLNSKLRSACKNLFSKKKLCNIRERLQRNRGKVQPE